MNEIDLRSDTVTRPTPAMLDAMHNAPVGDDVYGEDPTINALETKAAQLLNKEAALFVSSGTQANLIALLCHCERGEEYVAGQMSHTYRYEGGGGAVFGGIQPQPINFEEDGSLCLKKVAEVIKPDDPHFARTRLLCLENTQSGKALSMSYLTEARQFADSTGLSLHLDGARLFNACVAVNATSAQIADTVDSVAFCLSKGLGAPVGSMLCGTSTFIQKARRWRKALGGGMRQAGSLAAAGIYALDHHCARLHKDHDNAQKIASALRLKLDDNIRQATNMVFIDSSQDSLSRLYRHMGKHQIRVDRARWVTHGDVGEAEIERILSAISTL